MDWTKAKTILIIALLFTNIVLLSTYMFSFGRIDAPEEDVVSDTLVLLATKNIKVETEIPNDRPRMSVLSIEYEKLDQAKIKAALKKQEPLPETKRSKEDYIAVAAAFVRAYSDTAVVNECIVDGDEAAVSFRNVYEEIPVEKSYLNCSFKKGKLISFEGEWLKPMELGRTKKRIMSAPVALIKFMADVEANVWKDGQPERIQIQRIELVYWLDTYALDGTVAELKTDVAFPAWKITYNKEQTKYISAFEQ